MDSPAPKPGHLRNDLPGLQQPATAEPKEGPPLPRKRSDTGWNIALFVWVTAFGFLVAYELITMVFRLFKVR
jgi:hypothetical protein